MRIHASVAATVLYGSVLAATSLAQQQGPVLVPFGVSHPPSVVPPTIRVVGQPLLGQPIGIDVVGGLPNQFGIVAAGLKAPPLVLPSGHTIYVPMLEQAFPVVLDADGEALGAVTQMPLPAAFLGIDFAAQGAFFDASYPDGFATTRGTQYRLAEEVDGPRYPGQFLTSIDPAALRIPMDIDGDGTLESVQVRPGPGTGGSVFIGVQEYEDILVDNPSAETQVIGVHPSGLFDLRDAAAGDLDGNGTQDIVLANGRVTTTNPDAAEILWIFNGGNGGFLPVIGRNLGTGNGTDEVTACALGDHDGDGDLDLFAAVTNAQLATTEIVLLTNDGLGDFQTATRTVLATLMDSAPEPITRMITADLDGDGRDDVIAVRGVQQGSGGEVLILSTALGGVQSVVLPSPPGDAEVADLDQDGRPDLGLSLRNSPSAPGAAAILFQDANSTFPQQNVVTFQETLAGATDPGLIIADLAGDSAPDLGYAVFDASGIHVLRAQQNLGGRQFQPVPVAALPAFEALRRFDPADGRPPVLLSADPGQALTSITRSLLSGGFAAPLPSPLADAARLQVIADFTGDGIDDAIVEQVTAGGQLSARLWLGTGLGAFIQAPVPDVLGGIPVDTGSFAPLGIAADLDADGLLDYATIVPVSGGSSHLFVATWKASGQLAQSDQALLPGTTSQLDVADTNNDGSPDLVVHGSAGRQVRLNSGNATFSTLTLNPQITPPLASRLGDMNGDGIIDVVLRYSTTLTVALGTGLGTFKPQQQFPAPPGVNPALELADADGDGRLDVVVVDIGGGAQVLGNDGSGGLLAGSLVFSGSALVRIQIVDLDGDGRLDLLGTPTLATNSSRLVIQDDVFGANPPPLREVAAPVISQGPWVAEVNGDGLPDLVLVTGSVGVVGATPSLIVYQDQRGGVR